MLSKIASATLFASACLAENYSRNANEVSQIDVPEATQLYDGHYRHVVRKNKDGKSMEGRQSPINININSKTFPTVIQDEAFTAKFGSSLSFKNVMHIKHEGFAYVLEGRDMEFKTSLS